MIKQAMISQPMAGLSDEQIIEVKKKATTALQSKGYRVLNTFFGDEWHKQEAMERRGITNIPLHFLAESLDCMSYCHAVYFCKGWDKTRGCIAEHDIAKAYGLEIIYEDD